MFFSTSLRVGLLVLGLWGWMSTMTSAAPVASSVLPAAQAEKGDEAALSLTMADCITRALSKNLDISIQRITPMIAASQTLSARGIYDPNLQLQAQYGASEYQTSFNTLSSTSTQSSSYSGSLSQLTPIGTQLSFIVNSASTQDNVSYLGAEYTSFSGVNVTQPLLRNFGSDVTEAQIRIALRGEAAAGAEFLSQVQQIISNVASAYYELMYARDSLATQEKSLSLAQELLDDNKIRFKIGTMTPLDVSQASAEVATRRSAVLQARQALTEQENTLKRLITDDFVSMADQRIIPLDQPAVDLQGKPALEDMQAALRNRPDYREAIERAEQSKIQLVYNQNQVLPQLNLNASYGFGGLGTNLTQSFNTVTSTDYPQWYVGFSVQVPIGNRAAEGQRDAAKLQKLQALLQIKKLEQDILVQVNNASTQVKTNQERVGVSSTATAYSKDALDAEQHKLTAGATTTYTVLQMQRDLAQAETDELRAIADLRISQVELYRVEGLTLRVYHVVLDSNSAAQNAIPKKQ